MDTRRLELGLATFKVEIERAIQSARFNGTTYPSGHAAKEALIRSQRLIQIIHEVTKESLRDAVQTPGTDFVVHPPIGATSPELKITGFLKAKNQDIVVLTRGNLPTPTRIADGPLAGEIDIVGPAATRTSVVVGIRSQMSSVAKNFDTLMERAFAETLNLRLRFHDLTMGEVYLLPVYEYDDTAMRSNRVAFKSRPIPILKFIRTFAAISGRDGADLSKSLYKYERTALVLANFRVTPPRVYYSLAELIADGLLPTGSQAEFDKLSPRGFACDLLEANRTRRF